MFSIGGSQVVAEAFIAALVRHGITGYCNTPDQAIDTLVAKARSEATTVGERMLADAVANLATISDALGVPEAEALTYNGPDELVARIRELKARAATGYAQDPCGFLNAVGEYMTFEAKGEAYRSGSDQRLRAAVKFSQPLFAAPPRQPGALADLHPLTGDLVTRFCAALADKLFAAQKKLGDADGWWETGWMNECRSKLAEHVAKGDPLDVAAFAAFLWHHNESTCPHGAAPDVVAAMVSAAIDCVMGANGSGT